MPRKSGKPPAPPVAPPGKPPEPPGKPEKPTKAKAKTWLKGRGHKAKAVDDAIDGANDVIDGLRALHGISAEQYQAGKQ